VILGDGPAARLENVDNLRTISGFYPTPASVVDMMLERIWPIQPDHRVLEPSAGRGDIADRVVPLSKEVVLVEPNPVLAAILREKGYEPIERPFEEYAPAGGFDRIAMNPPFAQGRDITHVRRAFELLNPGGILVALMNDGDAPGDSSPEQRKAFGAWLINTHEIASLSLKRLEPELFLSSENFRASLVRMKLVRLSKQRAFAAEATERAGEAGAAR
jgi:hypothetical protein